MVKNYRHPVKFYLVAILGGAIFLAFTFIAWYISYTIIHKQGVSISAIALLLVGNICSIAAIYFSRIYFKNTPTVKIDGDYIWFNKKKYALSDIELVQFSGKKLFSSALSSVFFEALIIHFKNGELKYAFDVFYTNLYKIKQELYNRVDISKHSKLRPKVVIAKMGTRDATYKTSQFKSFRGILLWFFILLVILDIIILHGQLSIRSTCFVLGFMAFHSIWMYYPSIKNEHLILKNHNLLWVHRKFRLDNIDECVFDTHYRWPYCLRIITKDFKQYHYPCSTLCDKQWLAFKKHLESKGIYVRNECIAETELPSFWDIM
jgi:hypothetical protein